MSINFGFIISKFLRRMNRPALRNCVIDKTSKVGTGSNCIGLTMGRYSYMGKNNSVCNVEIGSFCSIASYCAIGGASHRIDTISSSPVFYEGRNVFNKHFAHFPQPICEKVIIGNDVWIGEGVFIKDGVIIGDGAVIGAHSVVTHDIPPYAIVAGAPSQIIRYRFDKHIIAKLLNLKWWNWSEERLKQLGSSYSDINSVLK